MLFLSGKYGVEGYVPANTYGEIPQSIAMTTATPTA
jgi:hypothetical protein